MDINESDKLWLAGFFEAEGCIADYKTSLYQNDPAPLLWAQKKYGGRLVKRTRKSPASDKICEGHELHFRADESKVFIEDILPYLRVPRKIEQIKRNKTIDETKILPELSKEQLNAYFAGFWEGDGYISNDISFNNSLVVGMDQQTEKPLDIVKSSWGGFIRKRERKSPASDKICTTYAWVGKGKIGRKFCDNIKPYMRIPQKITQLENAIKKTDEKLNRTFKCNFCEKTYSNPPNRRRHEVQCHSTT